jgi:hypothetical protein
VVRHQVDLKWRLTSGFDQVIDIIRIAHHIDAAHEVAFSLFKVGSAGIRARSDV